MRCLRDILNDETYHTYDTYSDINIIPTATVSTSNILEKLRTLNVLLLPPEPPPSSHIQVYDIPEEEYTRDEILPIGRSVICLEEEGPTTKTTTDTSHLLWDSPMVPPSDLKERRISPSTIEDLSILLCTYIEDGKTKRDILASQVPLHGHISFISWDHVRNRCRILLVITQPDGCTDFSGMEYHYSITLMSQRFSSIVNFRTLNVLPP